MCFCILIELSTILREIHQLSSIRRRSLSNKSPSKTLHLFLWEWVLQTRMTITRFLCECWNSLYKELSVNYHKLCCTFGESSFLLQTHLNLGAVSHSSAPRGVRSLPLNLTLKGNSRSTANTQHVWKLEYPREAYMTVEKVCKVWTSVLPLTTMTPSTPVGLYTSVIK